MENIALRAPLHHSYSSYRASFKLERGSHSEQIFEGKQAAIVISIGQPYHEGDKFLSTIELINRSAFGNCHVILADTLQRYNFYKHMNDVSAFEHAKQKGDEWLKRNQYCIEKIRHPYSIMRWEQFLNHQNFLQQKQRLFDYYAQNLTYQNIIHSDVEKYIERLDASEYRELVFNYGVEYIIEECAIAMLLWPTINYDFIIYPKPMTASMSITRGTFINNNNQCCWLPMRFRKRKNSAEIETI